MGYHGEPLHRLFEQTPAHRAMSRMARGGGDYMRDRARENTPVKTGALRRNWELHPRVGSTRIRRRGGWAYEVRVVNATDYAAAIEHGTGMFGKRGAPYEIRPKGGTFLTWVDPRSGRRVYARRVMHPGSPGHHMLALAAAVSEARFEGAIGASVLGRWKVEQEAQVR